MKVPIYQRQTQLTRDSGARPLSAMASPSAYAEPANAAFKMGVAISGAGDMLGDIALTEIRQENATMLASEEAKFSDFVFNKQNEAVAGPIGQSRMVPNPNAPAGPGPRPGNLMPGPAITQQEQLQQFKVQMQKRINSQASRIKDPDVRRKFKASAASKMRTAMPGIQTQLRSRYLDRHRAQNDQNIVQMRRELSRHPFNSPTFKEKVRETELKIQENGILNGETEQNILKEIRTFRSDVVMDHVLDELQAFSMRDAAASRTLGRAIDNYANPNSPYHNLTPDAANKLSKMAKRQADMDELRLVRQSNEKERQDEKNAKKQGVKNTEGYLNRIRKVRTQAVGGPPQVDSEGREITMPTATDILLDRTLTDDQKDEITKAMVGADKIFNRPLVNNLRSAIRDAVTDDDLEAVSREIKNHYSRQHIGQLARSELLSDIDNAKKKTPEFLEIKQYHDYLKRMTRITDDEFGGKVGLGQTFESMQSAEIFRRYDVGLEAGLRPAEAAFQVISQFVREKDVGIKGLAQGLPKNMRNLIVKRNALDGGQDLQPDLTANLVKMRQMYTNMLNGYKAEQGIEEIPLAGKTQQQLGEAQRVGVRVGDATIKLKRSQRIGVRRLFAIESRINAIETIHQRVGAAANDSGGAPAVEESNWYNPFSWDWLQGRERSPTANRQ